MRKIYLLVAFFVFAFSEKLWAQNTTMVDSLMPNKKYKKVYFHHWGYAGYFENDNNCTTLAHNCFGVEHISMGCVITKAQIRRWHRKNRKAERILISRFGQNWKEKYNAAYIKCMGAHS